MQRSIMGLTVASVGVAALAGAVLAQAPPAGGGRVSTEAGFGVFQQHCLGCHGNPAYERAPSPAALREMAPERIYSALTEGVMKPVGDTLTEDERKLVAQAVAGRLFGAGTSGDAASMPNRCADNPPFRLAAGPAWNGWGVDASNNRFQPAAAAGLSARDVPGLKLKWAFGLPDSTSAYSQPTVADGRLFVGTDTGQVYSLNAATGCVHWSFLARSAVRNAPVLGPGRTGPVVYFGDLKANVYALDARTGAKLWTTRVETHLTDRVTAAPAIHNGRLYVPISSWEEFAARSLDYGCCTSVGAVAALDAATGRRLWKTYVIASRPQPTRLNSKGVQQYGPAGGSVWNTPAVDPQRRAIYFGTGDATTFPAADTSDSVMALDMATGRRLWSRQVHHRDSFLVGCNGKEITDNCPKVQGPDWDIPASVILKRLPGGRRLLLVGTKPGDVLALDPDRKGAQVWRVNVSGGPLAGDGPTPPGQPRRSGIQWGGTADDSTVYYGLTGGGVVALDIATGHRRWFSPMDDLSGPESVARGAPASGIPGVVFVGGSDGSLVAVSSTDGHRLWRTETSGAFDTVNKVAAHGGSIISIGPTIAGGMLFVGSGYAVAGGRPGNVLLAYSAK